MVETGDNDLIQAVVRQDPAALLALYDRYGRIAFALAYRILDDAGTAEEAVQDAFLQIWRRASSFDPSRGSGLRAWLLTVVHNRAIDLRRRRAGYRWEVMGDEAIERIAGPDLWSDVVNGLDRDQIRAALAILPTDQRNAIELAYFEGLTHREIAEQISAPLGTVKGRLRLGLQKLSGLLAEPG